VGRSTCSPSWYQPSGQVYLLAKLVPAQRALLPSRWACTSSASRPTCSRSWYMCQSSKQDDLLPGLVQVPARWAGLLTKSHPPSAAEWWSMCLLTTAGRRPPSKLQRDLANLVSRFTCLTNWHVYQPGEEVDLLTKLVRVPAWRGGSPHHQAGTCTSPARRLTSSPSWYMYQSGKDVDLRTKLVHSARIPRRSPASICCPCR
jgi:hypothetical protein